MNEQEHEGILAIFLAEAEEIVQRLSEQLAELRYGYDGQRILDDIHRGFHTLYGGATVLEMAELAECSRLAERAMERVRSRRVSMTPSLVSLLVAVIGALELMLARRINHQSPSFIDGELKSRLLRAADRNHNPFSANNMVEIPAESMGLFFDGRLRPREDTIASMVPSVLQYESASYEPFVTESSAGAGSVESSLNASHTARLREGVSIVESTNVNVSSSRGDESRTLSSEQLGSETRLNNVGHLVSELSWVKQRLMKFHSKGQSTELDKALTYLDLVTQDFENWRDEQGS
ncbi:Uncharacterised protein [Zhongshania aliphaticivorans]|uniref:HPt domain-containing protein n=1 Tax=Zhongshania aliphaticivorans TaxID=1470434 RepID=A0A5S9QDP8_9GAMM|nr:Hpt domain-containing protein [Zhongshania aliphaticivorans]CAA0087774.1 Uncharacterised protein [Zhongshania aliphaticivorans]CAA0115442.1 Uncharacterised protein [Zhongshania aliphaticivorans]CAA0120227.1 Uncharacterised protein [Zhongshania aliphaticivorans]